MYLSSGQWDSEPEPTSSLSLCFEFLLAVKKQEQGPIVLHDPCRHIVDKKQVDFKEAVLLRECYSVRVCLEITRGRIIPPAFVAV